MVKVFQNNKYTETKRAGADMARLNPALVKLTIDKVLAIAGTDHDSCDALFSVSSYDIKRDTWQIDLPKLNTARDAASACVLKANVYVFCGMDDYRAMNTIEVISEFSIFSESTATWSLI